MGLNRVIYLKAYLPAKIKSETETVAVEEITDTVETNRVITLCI